MVELMVELICFDARSDVHAADILHCFFFFFSSYMHIHTFYVHKIYCQHVVYLLLYCTVLFSYNTH